MTTAPLTGPELLAKWHDVIEAADYINPKVTGLHELAYWAEEASRARTIVEIGTYVGHSAKVMLLANPSAHLWTIDPFYEAGSYEKAKTNLSAQLATGRCEILRMRCVEACKDWSHGKIDLLISDDGHEEQDVEDDLRSFYPLLKIGGTACGHDFDTHPRDNGVAKAVKRMLPFYHCPVPRVWSWTKDCEAHWP